MLSDLHVKEPKAPRPLHVQEEKTEKERIRGDQGPFLLPLYPSAALSALISPSYPPPFSLIVVRQTSREAFRVNGVKVSYPVKVTALHFYIPATTGSLDQLML